MATLMENARAAATVISNFQDYCTNGNNLVIPVGTKDIGMGIFIRQNDSGYADKRLQNVSFPSTLESIGYQSFADNHRITGIVIPHGCKFIYARAFAGCVNLKSISLPNTLKTVSASCFTPNSNLTEFNVENNFNCDLGPQVVFTSANLSAEGMVAVFNNLKDRTNETAYTLTFGSTNLAKLTAEQKAIATNKNWNLA